jgi:hypothetical protein
MLHEVGKIVHTQIIIMFTVATALVSCGFCLLIPLPSYTAFILRTTAKRCTILEKDCLWNNEKVPSPIFRLSALQVHKGDDEQQDDIVLVDPLQPVSTAGGIMTRRGLFQIVTASAVASTNYLSASRSSNAFASDDEDIENGGIIDNNRDGRIVLRTSTSNLPTKYEKTALAQVLEDSSPAELTLRQQQQTNICACESTEQRRIRVFERSAPSVVYIDTYAVQRDAFSPNM